MIEKKPGQLKFGELPQKEAAHLRRERKKGARPVENLEVYDIYRLTPLIREAVLEDSERYRKGRGQFQAESNKILQKVWGEDVALPDYVSPSTIANCLRWIGYEKFGYKPAPRTFEAEMGMKLGGAGHYALLNILRRFGIKEQSILEDETGISGRLDFIFRHPVTGEYQVLDLKFPGDWGFKQIKREGLPEYLKKTKDIYNPSHEARLQLLIYMGAKRRKGCNVTMGNIIYINRDNGKMKECIVPWDALAEHDMKEFLGNLAEARKKIQKKELPESTAVSKYVCKSFCHYSHHCEEGKKFLAGKIKRGRKRRPQWVYRKAREQAEERKQKMIERGIVQPELPLKMSEEHVADPTSPETE